MRQVVWSRAQIAIKTQFQSRRSWSRRLPSYIQPASRSISRSATGHTSSPPCRPADWGVRLRLQGTYRNMPAYGPTPFLWSFRLTRHTTRVSRKDGTECPLGGPRARRGAGSGGTPDMADTREKQSNQAIVVPIVGELLGDIMLRPAYPGAVS